MVRTKRWAAGTSIQHKRDEGLRRRLLSVAALAVGALTLSVSATSSIAGASGTVSQGAVVKAAKSVKAAAAPPHFVAPGPKIDANKASGKTLWIINIASSIPLVQATDAAATQALGLVGAKVVQYDGKGEVSEYTAGIDEAITQHASAIALFAINPSLVAGPVQKATTAGIPVIVMQYGDPGAKMPLGLTAQVTYCYSCAGRDMANFITSQSGKTKPGVALIESQTVSNSKWEDRGFVSTYKKACKSCTLIQRNVPVANWETEVPTLTESLIRAHPTLNYIIPIYDGMALYAIPAVHTAGAASRVKVVTFNGSLGDMQDMAAGNVVTCDVGSPEAGEGWALADQFFRVVTGEKPATNEVAALRLFDSSNVTSINLKTPESTWYGVNYTRVYRALWGLG